MNDLLRKIKQLFSRKKSPESIEMWDKLSAATGDSEFHPALDLNMTYYYGLKTQKEKDQYLVGLMRRRNVNT